MTVDAGEAGKRRDATTAAMLDAAEQLFAERGFTAVSVRDIAHRAGVSHALVHRYLGSKKEIYRAVLARNEDVMRAAAGDTEDLDVALSRMVREGLASRRSYLRLVAHSALHGLPYDTSIVTFAAVQRLIELAEARASRAGRAEGDVAEPRVAIATIVALYLGWVSLEPWIVRATGLEDMDEAALAGGLERIILGIADANVPGDDG
jgi:AcrR family transcriptional regulator